MLWILVNLLVAVLIFILVMKLVGMIKDPKARQIVTIIVIVIAIVWLIQVFCVPGPYLYWGTPPRLLR